MTRRVYRVLVAKIGLDGHDRGAKIIAQSLRDSGYEVIYTGLHQTPAQVATIAIQEDVDAIGVSILSGAHNVHLKRLMEELAIHKMERILVFCGGVIPKADENYLQELGVRKVFTSGASLKEIVSWLDQTLRSNSLN